MNLKGRPAWPLLLWLVKVALLTDCYLPRLGGIEVQMHDLGRQLVAAGHEVHAFTATRGADGTRHGSEVIDGVQVHRLAIPLPGNLPVNPFAPRELRSVLGDFDVAHVAMGVVSPFAMDSTRVALGLGVPTAVTWHCVQDRFRFVVQAAGYVRRWSTRGAALSAVSSVAAAPLVGLSSTPVAVLPNGISVATWAPSGPLRVPPGDVVEVVSAMRLATRKRPVELVAAVGSARSTLADRGVDLRLTILGDGPLRSRVEREAARYGEGWLDLPGRATREELRSRYLSSDLYVAPARLEAFGIAALEARTVGLPVVAPAMSGVSEFVADGVNGVLTGPTTDDLAAGIVRLAGDLPLLRQITLTNQTSAPACEWPDVVRAALAEYRRAGA